MRLTNLHILLVLLESGAFVRFLDISMREEKTSVDFLSMTIHHRSNTSGTVHYDLPRQLKASQERHAAVRRLVGEEHQCA